MKPEDRTDMHRRIRKGVTFFERSLEKSVVRLEASY